MNEKRFNLHLLCRFLKGSLYLFLLSILFSAISSLADMLIPQIIRITVDNVVGNLPADLPQFAMDFIEKIGGFSYLKEHLEIMALGLFAF